MNRTSGWITLICGAAMIISSMLLIATTDQEIKHDLVFGLHMTCIFIGIILLWLGQLTLRSFPSKR